MTEKTKNPIWYENEEKNPRVGIAISAFGSMPMPFVLSLTELIKESMFNGVVIDIVIDISKPLDKSRNICVKKLMKDNPDYIFFMDSDMTYKPDTLLKLLKQDKDIITGVYCYKSPPYNVVLKMLNEREKRYSRIWKYPKGKLFKVDGCGAGCLLVKKSVFEDLEEPWFVWHPKTSEDFYFCRTAREKDYEIWADGRVECGHISEISVMPDNFWQKQEAFRDKVMGGGLGVTFVDYDKETEDPKE